MGEKLYVDLVSMSENIRGNQYLLAAEDSFCRYCRALMDQHFNVYRLPDQLYSDNGRDFVNNLWRELFSEFKDE